MITVSVPGKIHLMGEHAVVYGKPAILAAINRRMTVRVEAAKEFIVKTTEPPDYARHAAEMVAAHFAKPLPNIAISIYSDIAPGFHLGSSAATAVAVVAAVTFYMKKVWNPDLFNKLAYEVEKKMHGNPSGGDNTTVTMGGLIWFRRELEFLRSVWQLPVKIPPAFHHFYLVNTGRPHENTGFMVAGVAANYKKYPRKIEEALALNEVQTKRIATAFKNASEDELVDAIRVGHTTLVTMGVVSAPANKFAQAIVHAGGAAKILGGGGLSGPVGYMLVYMKDKARAQKISEEFGFTLEDVELGEEGIRLENKN